MPSRLVAHFLPTNNSHWTAFYRKMSFKLSQQDIMNAFVCHYLNRNAIYTPHGWQSMSYDTYMSARTSLQLYTSSQQYCRNNDLTKFAPTISTTETITCVHRYREKEEEEEEEAGEGGVDHGYSWVDRINSPAHRQTPAKLSFPFMSRPI